MVFVSDCLVETVPVDVTCHNLQNKWGLCNVPSQARSELGGSEEDEKMTRRLNKQLPAGGKTWLMARVAARADNGPLAQR